MKAGGEGGTADEMIRWNHQLNEYEFEEALGDTEGQGSLAFCSPWGRKVSDVTKGLNNSNKVVNSLGSGSYVHLLVSF